MFIKTNQAKFLQTFILGLSLSLYERLTLWLWTVIITLNYILKILFHVLFISLPDCRDIYVFSNYIGLMYTVSGKKEASSFLCITLTKLDAVS